MNEQELRSLVREAVDRHLRRPGSGGDDLLAGLKAGSTPTVISVAQDVRRAGLQASHSHTSHLLLNVVPGSAADDGQCVIEPAVRCTHCGFCQSYGH